MKTIIQISEAEEAKALPILLRHSPSTVLPNRIYVVSEDAAKKLRQAAYSSPSWAVSPTLQPARELALVKEDDLFVPLYYNDGRQIEPQKLQALQQQLPNQFGGLTFVPQPNQGLWIMAGIIYRDEIVIHRVIRSDAQAAWRFLSEIKERLKEALQQEEILIVERDVETL